MDQEQSIADMDTEKEKLAQEKDQLKMVLSLVKENQDLRARLHDSNSETQDKQTVCSPSGSKLFGLGQTFEERHFTKHLQTNQGNHEHRTSSPVDFKSFLQSSMHTNKGGVQSCQADTPLEVKATDRLMGEIAYQLDRRILSYVFQAQKRLYGFTLLNIQEKIMEVSTHPLTGKVDEGYRLYLTARYADIMEQLGQLGYKAKLHPIFTEFIINTYGILKERPDEYSSYANDFNRPDFLGELITTVAPLKLQKDLLLVLTCLCNMAEKDRKPLLLW